MLKLAIYICALIKSMLFWGFPGDSDDKQSTSNAGDPGSIPELGRYPKEGNCKPCKYYFMKNPMDSGAWQAPVHGVTKSQT